MSRRIPFRHNLQVVMVLVVDAVDTVDVDGSYADVHQFAIMTTMPACTTGVAGTAMGSKTA